MIRTLIRSPLPQAIVAWHVIWGIPALLVDAAPMIAVLNLLVFAMAIGVIVAYAPSVGAACLKARPSEGDILVVGVWLAWVSLVEARLWSVIWRALDQPKWLVSTDITTHILAVALLAGIMHLAGPEAIEGKVPTRQWIRIGLIAAAGALCAIVMLLFFGETGTLLPRG